MRTVVDRSTLWGLGTMYFAIRLINRGLPPVLVVAWAFVNDKGSWYSRYVVEHDNMIPKH